MNWTLIIFTFKSISKYIWSIISFSIGIKKIKLSKSFTKPNYFYIGHASCNRNSYVEDHTNDEHRLPMQQNHSLEFKSTEKGTYSQQGTVYGM